MDSGSKEKQRERFYGTGPLKTAASGNDITKLATHRSKKRRVNTSPKGDLHSRRERFVTASEIEVYVRHYVKITSCRARV
jgi:hypothetical protein